VKVLLFGAKGQVGTEIERAALRRGFETRALGRADVDLADATRVKAAVAASDADVVINAAAYTAVDQAEGDAARCLAVNRDGPAALAEACAARRVPLIHFSTDYVFDGTKTDAYVESDTTHPLSTYGKSKEAGERAIRRSHHRHVILRTSWVYAAHGSNFLRTMLRLAQERDELRVVDDQRGAPTSAGDLARTALAVAERVIGKKSGVLPPFGTYHCTAAGETTWCGFARTIFDLAGRRLGRRPRVTAINTADYPTAATRPKNSTLDNTRLAAAFEPPRRPWQDGLRDVLDELLGPA
jgi:dTDP-4-dehydrorhamnose reductase